ncbi:MAG TPA: hypothetical protein VK471_09445 [Solirubrobacterales bacterium]|nr:hypothetical protein [Solirubrobacterales bacterium]
MLDPSHRSFSRPEALHELRPLVVGSERLISAIAGMCAADVLRPSDRQKHWAGDCLPDFLLVEDTGGIEAQWDGELDVLLDRCERAGIPRLLWIGVSPIRPYWLDRCARFDRVFTMDVGQLEQLEAAGAQQPSVLWPATSLPIGEAWGSDTDDRPDAVVWLGGWRRDWSAEWIKQLTSVLRGAAECELRIFEAENMDDMPSELRPCVAGATGVANRRALLHSASVVICADPVVGSPTFAPPIVFDAAACGAAVVTPHRFATRYDFGVERQDEDIPNSIHDALSSNPLWDLVPHVTNSDATLERVGLLLRDKSLRDESVSHLRRIVFRNHTYHSRLATLASAIDCRLIPDALGSASA